MSLHDPYRVPPEAVPLGMAYQWCRPDRIDKSGWTAVPSDRHPGQWPLNSAGCFEVGGLILAERTQADVEAAKAHNIAAVAKQMDDWAIRAGGTGLSGGVNMQFQTGRTVSPVYRREIGSPSLASQIKRLTGGYPADVLRRFREVWEMPYVVVPQPI